MFKNSLFILVLGIFVSILVIVGLFIAGNPISQQGIKYDEVRLSNFSSIRYQIEFYYEKNNLLPENLHIFDSQPNLRIIDPETKKPYDYQILSPTSYKLCTIFSTDSQSANSQYSFNDSNSFMKHKKGFDCITYTIPL